MKRAYFRKNMKGPPHLLVLPKRNLAFWQSKSRATGAGSALAFGGVQPLFQIRLPEKETHYTAANESGQEVKFSSRPTRPPY